jgi:phenylacetate-CoA ligase
LTDAMQGLYAPLFRTVLYPAWETIVRARPTLSRLDYLERTQWRSLDELLAMQTGAVRRLVRHCYDSVPFYRQRMSSVGALPGDIQTLDDLRRLPVVTRQDARATKDERSSMSGPKPTIKKTTGGTTGEPLLFGYEADSEYWRTATKLRGYGWAGYRLGDHALHYWGLPTRPLALSGTRLKTKIDRLLRRDHYIDCGLRGDADLARVVDFIKRSKPKTLVCYTQAAADLARYILANGLRDWGNIPVVCGAERLFASDREVLERAFGPAVFETYGCREVMLIASECPHHDGMHESMENVVVEIVVTGADGKTRPANEGELGEVVLTDLHNFAMPFLRYANGDLAIAGPRARCACGRALRRIRAVEGRTTETLRDAQGQRVSGMVFNLIFSVLASTVRQFQAVQHKDSSITLKVIPTHSLDATAMDHIRRNCEKYLRGIPVTVERVAEIPLSKSGKRQPVIVES